MDSTRNIIQDIIIHESVHQSLPTVDINIVNDTGLIEDNPLTDGSQIDIELTILQTENEEEQFRIETFLWSHEAVEVSEGIQLSLHCVLSASDFLEGRIESVNGSSFDVFSLMAERSRMTLIADPSVDKQVWIRAGIRGNIWLNDVINHSWASDRSAFIYAVTRNRELLKYNLDERASRNPKWVFKPEREYAGEELDDNVIKYKYPKFTSQSGFLNTFFGYGRRLSSFDIESGDFENHQPKTFIKRTNFMNLNSDREVPQRYTSLGFNNNLNVHANYFNAYAQNMRIKSFYSINVSVLSNYFRAVRLLDRVSLSLNDESQNLKRTTYSGNYFVEKISTILDSTNVTRRFDLIREGFNADSSVANRSK
ncbi:MAG: hypothetical protein HKO92_11450 [Flavobacteriaceae bacterium]|nr:hypothetical protein [Flavobacteriaceae bacterium]